MNSYQENTLFVNVSLIKHGVSVFGWVDAPITLISTHVTFFPKIKSALKGSSLGPIEAPNENRMKS